MAIPPTQRKPLNKANSPVKKTGENSSAKKRLLKADIGQILKGRETILQAARVCFSRQGFAGTSIKDIQEVAGISRGNLYHHFKTKEEIIQIIITQNLDRFCNRVETSLNDLSERNLRLADVIHELAALAEEITKGPGKGMAFHVWSLAMVDADVRKTMTDCFERIRSALEKKIVLMIEQGKIKKTNDFQELSVSLFGIVIPAFTLQSVFMDEKSIDAKKYASTLEQLFNNSLPTQH